MTHSGLCKVYSVGHSEHAGTIAHHNHINNIVRPGIIN